MFNNKSALLRGISLSVFVAIELFIWIVLMFFPFDGVHIVYYGAIVFCLLYSLTLFSRENHSLLQYGAFFFTVVADYFLILREGEYKTAAMLVFLIAQIIYGVRTMLYASGRREGNINIALRIALSIAGALSVYILLGRAAEPLFALSLAYYVNLLISIVFAYIHFKDSLSAKLLAIGLTLFALCDIAIGFDFLVKIFSLTEGNIIYEITRMKIPLTFVFYIPSQILLTASIFPFSQNKSKE